MLTILLMSLHILVSVVLILVVLLQTGKRADLAGAFGGGGSQTAFGARGAATFLSKATTWSAITFMLTSIILGVHFGRESSSSVVQDSSSTAPGPAAPPAPQPVPVQTPPPSPIPADGAKAPANPPPGQSQPEGQKAPEKK
ncbi:MAG TPA: preprotein translocase subunit SecG [Actinomycetota bacterium]